MKRALLYLALLIPALGVCQAMAQGRSTAQTGQPPVPSFLPVRLELGGYYSWADRGYGDWRGLNGEFWFRGNRRFVPGLLIDSQTRPTGTQQNYAFMSYLNWSRSFYTVQSISIAPQRSTEAVYFPKARYDIKGYWKLPPDENLAVSAGFTHFDFGTPGRGEIYNVGILYYRNRLVMEGNLFVNQSRPGNLWSGSGSFSLQYGTEGRYWLGLRAGGGRELYRLDGVAPVEVGLSSYSFDLFYRRWVSRHIGYVIGATYQDKLDAYRRAGAYTRVFFEF